MSFMIFVENEIVIDWLDKGMIVDASAGGLVFGNRHSEGGIKILQLVGKEIYQVGEMEGGEFLINCLAREKNLPRIAEIVAYKGKDEGLGPEEASGIRHYIVPPGHLIYVGKYSGSIISRAGTRKYLDELIKMNEETAGIFLSEEQK